MTLKLKYRRDRYKISSPLVDIGYRVSLLVDLYTEHFTRTLFLLSREQTNRDCDVFGCD